MSKYEQISFMDYLPKDDGIKLYQSGLIQPVDRDYKKHKKKRQEHIEFKDDDISHTLMTNSNSIPVTAVAQRTRENKQKLEVSNREYANAITTATKDSMIKSNLKIRKLTPRECWRLMGFSDEEFDKASKVNSNNQLYKQAGNSIVVNLLERILNNLL